MPITDKVTQLHGTPRVLYIEDDLVYGELVKHMLSTLGCTVDLKKTGADGLAAFQDAPYDIVAVDYRLPDITGIEICLKLRDIAPSLPLVIITGKGKASTPVEALSIDVPHYLEKGDTAEFTEGLINTFRHLIKNLPPTRA